VFGLLTLLKRPVQHWSRQVYHRLLQWMRPTRHPLLAGTFTDLTRTKSDLIAENALLRQQLIMLRRQVKRPACTKSDRLLLVLLARAVRRWKAGAVDCSAGYSPRLASSSIPLVLEAAIEAYRKETYDSG
jgi:putative transposase